MNVRCVGRLFGWNMAIYDNCQVLCPWPLCVSNYQVIGRVASPYCYKGQQKSGAAERGTLGGPVHTPAWTQYCACCCGLALLALCVLSAPGPKSASLKGHIPCAMLLEFHAWLIQYGKSLLQFCLKALSPSQLPLSLSPSSFCFCSMLQSELPGAICLQCFWCTVTRALCRVLLERKKMLD